MSLFEEGAADKNKKVKPKQASEMMRTLTDDAGNMFFDHSEWLTWQQISGFYSQYAKKRQEHLAQAASMVNTLNTLSATSASASSSSSSTQ
jgi:hypothetical protein